MKRKLSDYVPKFLKSNGNNGNDIPGHTNYPVSSRVGDFLFISKPCDQDLAEALKSLAKTKRGSDIIGFLKTIKKDPDCTFLNLMPRYLVYDPNLATIELSFIGADCKCIIYDYLMIIFGREGSDNYYMHFGHLTFYQV